MSAGDVAQFEVGDRVIDADADGSPTPAEVVEVTGETAADYHIDAINTTVAKANPGHPSDSPVIGIRFVRGDEPSGPTYHYPAARLEPISDDWEPPEKQPDGWHDRARIYGDHTIEVSAYIGLARELFTTPEATALDVAHGIGLRPGAEDLISNASEVLEGMCGPGRGPDPQPGPDLTDVDTRGECQYSRTDRYRPDTPGAICCWECSNLPNNRPEKYHVDNDAGPICTGADVPPWTLRAKLGDYIAIDGLAIPPETDVDAARLATEVGRLREAVGNNDDDTIRRKALRIAYRLTLEHVEEYNYGRARAILRDHDAEADLPILGDGSADRSDTHMKVTEYGDATPVPIGESDVFIFPLLQVAADAKDASEGESR